VILCDLVKCEPRLIHVFSRLLIMFDRILICNNGMAAAKFLVSLQESAHITDVKTPTFFGMVTKDDLQANASFIQYLDYVIQVPNGPSAVNFGNVDLIVELAIKHGCDAVWPGWGHASENYLLAKGLEEAGICFIGPDSDSMIRLGDKVESLLQAQKVGVPCAAWSGDFARSASECGLYTDAQVLSECNRIGYPVMLKASTGGGGKGIRRVDHPDDCLMAYNQIKAEVKDGYIFAMKCVEECRHVEIQIVGDGHGTCLALSGRDCSVQRRHQKLVEEGPPPLIPAQVMESMERAAERLCASVKYRCAGTVEFLINSSTSSFYFLEVNCRLQVEHPVTELLFNINLPLIQVMIAEGSRPLQSIPGLANIQSRKLDRHVVACRIVAEDPTNRWLPSSGEVFEIRTPPKRSDESFAYFGISSSGSRIHQFADSQFGHVFMVGETRAAAIESMHQYLSELSIVGSLSTNIQFMAREILNPSSDFAIKGPPTTNWLDEKYSQMKTNAMTRLLSFSDVTENDFSCPLALLAVCVHLASQSFSHAEKEILKWVRRGHRAPHAPTSYSERLICPGGERVHFETTRIGLSSVSVELQGSCRVEVDWEASTTGSNYSRAVMDVRGIKKEGSILVSVVTVSATKIKVQVGRNSQWFPFEIEEDRTKVVAPMNGRLVRWLVPHMHPVVAKQRVCEIEAMKMITVVLAKCNGILSHTVQEGVSFIEGDVLAGLEETGLDRIRSSESEPDKNEISTALMQMVVCKTSSVEDSLLQALDGFPVSAGLDKLSMDRIIEGVKRFAKDELRCREYISLERVGEEAAILNVISAASDADLVGAWRHRSKLESRQEIVQNLIEMNKLPISSLIELLNSLDERLHRTLMTTVLLQIRQFDSAHDLLSKFRSILSDDDDVTTEAGMSAGTPDDPIARRRAIAADAGSFFIYDLPSMLEEELNRIWSRHGENQPTEPLVACEQLVLNAAGDGLDRACSPSFRDCGMVAWLATLKTPEYPSGRRVIFIGSDISYQIGTFSVEEDKVYLYASTMARELGIPRIYFACNSGARMGLCQEVQKLFKVDWVDSSNLSAGFHCLYLSPEDYDKVKDMVRVREFYHKQHGRIFVLTDILGRPNEYLGVENLVWSGAIAGESSRAYQETFTLSYVTGRTVGIGAYIARLCQRIIQKMDSPILLTGFQALNKLIGAEVYQSNDEIGGVGVMFRNGVSHQVVESDAEGIASILAWLQFVPENMHAALPVSKCTDPIDRTLEDPGDGGRALVDDSTRATLFDKDSFVEVQAAWARSVIAGRARIGGTPIGVIVVETRQTHYFQPADPADPESHTVSRPQAGQVWYPDSAYKTAQAIMDFNREKLPLMILANWRGFSGGQRDMFNEILKFGSYIVDALREYKQPVFVYLPPRAELRGGAWVVVDSRINPLIEMYADPTARGGVLEPSGTTEIKFRTNALYDLMVRTDPSSASGGLRETKEHAKTVLMEHFNSVKPTLLQVANTFADMHDTPQRMKYTGAIRDIVEWSGARRFFHARLSERLR
jgi:biotin carboxylase/acetyl-CoA carboxylase carboxyltransferase component/biotin carboxyl carrier protein